MGRGVVLAATVLSTLLTACAGTPDDLVVLLPDAEGKVGVVTITTSAGTEVLNRAGQAAGISTSDAADKTGLALDGKQIDAIFGAAIKAQPDPPITFTFYFLSGTPRLNAKSKALIPEVLALIQLRPAPDIGVVGHTDRAGSDAYNIRLSLRRANSIRDRIVAAGVDDDLVQVTGHGENDPLVATPDGVAERRNRRVEVIVR